MLNEGEMMLAAFGNYLVTVYKEFNAIWPDTEKCNLAKTPGARSIICLSVVVCSLLLLFLVLPLFPWGLVIEDFCLRRQM